MWIAEPSTALTDFLLSAECLFFTVQLSRAPDHRGIGLWMFGFLALSLGALAGGSFHGFRPVLPPGLTAALWDVAMVLIGIAAGFMISGVLVSSAFEARRWLWAGLGVSAVGGLLLALKIGIHVKFNHNDLFHTVMLVALYCYYRGALLLQAPA